MAVFIDRMRREIDNRTPLIDETFSRTDIITMILAHGFEMTAFAFDSLPAEYINDPGMRAHLAKGYREFAARLLDGVA